MDRVKKHLYFLRYLSTLVSCVQRKRLLETASENQIIVLSEIAYNILEGVFKLNDTEFSMLQRYKNVVRTLASRELQVDEKRTTVVKDSIAVMHLLTVFFSHYDVQKHGNGWGEETYRNTSDSVPTAYSESDDDSERRRCVKKLEMKEISVLQQRTLCLVISRTRLCRLRKI